MQFNIIIRVLLVLLVCFNQTQLAAQQERELLHEVFSSYQKSGAFSMAFQVRYYTTATAQAPLFSRSGKMRGDKDHYWCNFLGKTILQNEDYSLIVDDSERMIICSKKKEDQNSAAQGNQFSMDKFIDSTFLYGSETKITGRENAVVRIQIKPQAGIYQSLEYSLDTTKKTLVRVEFIYKPIEEQTSSSKVIIDYSDINLNYATSKDDFDERKFITRKGGEIKGTGQYSTYELIDQTKNNDER